MPGRESDYRVGPLLLQRGLPVKLQDPNAATDGRLDDNGETTSLECI